MVGSRALSYTELSFQTHLADTKIQNHKSKFRESSPKLCNSQP